MSNSCLVENTRQASQFSLFVSTIRPHFGRRACFDINCIGNILINNIICLAKSTPDQSSSFHNSLKGVFHIFAFEISDRYPSGGRLSIQFKCKFNTHTDTYVCMRKYVCGRVALGIYDNCR